MVPSRPRSLLRCLARACATLAVVLFLCPQALATWSIVVLDRRTGEVCVATATCIPNGTIRRWVPVLRPGLGAAAAQSSIDSSAANRNIVWNALELGAPPDRILELLSSNGSSHQSRQYGIVSFPGQAVTFTGNQAGAAVCNLVGEVGDLSYAIQGNLLVGQAVCQVAEDALLGTDGDLATRVMAAMQAATALGGDGRCSCDPVAPTSCGVPPPGFTHASHTACIVLGRMGDPDGVCTASSGCANGEYYLKKQFNGDLSDLDAVVELQARVDAWRIDKQGVPDQLLSRVVRGAQELVADGQSSTTVTVFLRDLDDVPLTSGGAVLTVVPVHPAPDPAVAGPVTDNGDGSYSFELQAGTTPGRCEFRIWVDDGPNEVQLWPPLGIEVVAPTDLHCSWYEMSGAVGGPVTLTLDLPAFAGGAYHLLASSEGSLPGSSLGGVLVPLNPSRLFSLTVAGGLTPPTFEGFQGVLDGAGRAQAVFHVDPSWAWAFSGKTFAFAALVSGGGAQTVVGPVDFLMRP